MREQASERANEHTNERTQAERESVRERARKSTCIGACVYCAVYVQWLQPGKRRSMGSPVVKLSHWAFISLVGESQRGQWRMGSYTFVNLLTSGRERGGYQLWSVPYALGILYFIQ